MQGEHVAKRTNNYGRVQNIFLKNLQQLLALLRCLALLHANNGSPSRVQLTLWKVCGKFGMPRIEKLIIEVNTK